MSDNLIINVLGYSAGGIAVICSFPQLYQIIKTKKVRDLNPLFFILHSLSDFIYLSYGLLKKDYILSISVSMPALCNLIIFILWIFYNDDNEVNNTLDNTIHSILENIIEDSINKSENNLKECDNNL